MCLNCTKRYVGCHSKCDEYQKESVKTATFPSIGGIDFLYPLLGLAEESGELLGKFKKLYRDANGIMTEEFRAVFKKLKET